MSLEATCKICGEEFDMRHGLCPACKWRVKRLTQLETTNADLLETCKWLIKYYESTVRGWDEDTEPHFAERARQAIRNAEEQAK